MKKRLLLLTLIPCISFAGSFAQMLTGFESNSEEKVDAVKPNFIVQSIRRGTDDGNFASTSDAGLVTLQLTSLPENPQGYTFEIVEGKFEDQLFTGEPVTPAKNVRDKREFTFIWLDGSSQEQEPFNVKVKITGISDSGSESEPQYLVLSHPGVKKSWWKIW
ncbi:hypothetical protein Q4601_18000 [Shewanella sp. 1_MG-2023]|uniref:hypothetical protein n=1 Tax=unclassified Shewanella TaxID=196818 RepID=UPI0026E26AE8|nr:MULTISPECIES: hypothetical protein [unclassified Shewanella]MDO6613311.1 hypothetical protein [Shewanella sp. 7_MG-2023]MDO6773247.1 hypothetical protein [Shewanella sp. 2_MG-2023]MDO6796189.1 hypothetical protein [Shewanella sp. 1_MG-2023]